jgi:hypothetical protein
LNEIKDGNPRTRVQVECEHSYGHEHLLVGIFDIAASGSKRLDSNIVAERKAMMRMHTATRMRQRWKNRPNDSIKIVTACHYKCDGSTRLLGSSPIVEDSDSMLLTPNRERYLQRSRRKIDGSLVFICQLRLRSILQGRAHDCNDVNTNHVGDLPFPCPKHRLYRFHNTSRNDMPDDHTNECGRLNT